MRIVMATALMQIIDCNDADATIGAKASPQERFVMMVLILPKLTKFNPTVVLVQALYQQLMVWSSMKLWHRIVKRWQTKMANLKIG